MADNLAITPGSGATLATDETSINGTPVHVQRVTLGGAPTVAYGNTAITTTATLILAANYERKGFSIQPVDGTVYLGDDSSVTSSTGFPLTNGATFSSSAALGTIYAITASGTVNVRYWEEA